MTTINLKQLEERYAKMTSSVICKCEFATPCAGGLSATENGIRMFVQHHLKLTGEEAEAAVKRILSEEVGSRPVPSEEGELDEKMTYGINVIRRDDIGPYLGNWMIHANLKNAASRLGVFKEFRGSKGNFSEAAKTLASGISLLNSEYPNHVYLVGRDGRPAKTYFQEVSGRVQTPKGSMSIIHHTEFVPEGTQFEYEFRFLSGELSENDVADILALSMVVGIGSIRSLDHGKFKILSAEIVRNKLEKRKKVAVEASSKLTEAMSALMNDSDERGDGREAVQA